METVFEKTIKAFRFLQKNIPKLSECEKATLELMFNKEMSDGLKESMEDVRCGRIMTWEDIKKDLK